MNTLSSLLYFIGQKIASLKDLSTLEVSEPAINKVSLISAKNSAHGGTGKPAVTTVNASTTGDVLLGIGVAGSTSGADLKSISLPLSVANGGTGRTTDYADYIVERSSVVVGDNTWRYEKWNSGFVRATCITASASTAITTSAGAGYYVAKAISLPSELFKTITFADANRCLGTTAQSIVFSSVRSADKTGDYYTSVNTWIWAAQSATINISIGVVVEGTYI